MKVARKPIYAQQDCFEASEKHGRTNTRVRISRIRNTIIIDCETNSTNTQAEISLTQLAWLLRNAGNLQTP